MRAKITAIMQSTAHCRSRLATLVALAALAAPVPAHTTPAFSLGSVEALPSYGLSDTSIAYDAGTDSLSGQAIFRSGSLANGDFIDFVSEGALLFDAVIDDTGSVISGSASMVGGIPALGIADGTNLLDATIVAVGILDLGAGGQTFQILMEANSSLPVLGLGPSVGFMQLMGLELAPDPFQSDFGVPATSNATLSNVSVPEPATLALLALGFALLRVHRDRAC